jgi:ubiquinol-cytochrome c reductase iron-sulfur subunit
LKALSSIEVDIGQVPVGKTITVTWRGKPVFIRHRTKEEITSMQETQLSDLKDPQTDEVRVQDPNWIVCIAVCTHLGCVPVIGLGDFKAFVNIFFNNSSSVRKLTFFNKKMSW